MTIVSLREILGPALAQGYAVGYFEGWDQYSLEAIIETAQELSAPSILGFGAAVSRGSWFEAGGVEALATLARLLAERASVPVAVLYNEAQSPAQAMRGIAAGCMAASSVKSVIGACPQRVVAATRAGSNTRTAVSFMSNDTLAIDVKPRSSRRRSSGESYVRTALITPRWASAMTPSP